MRKSLIILLFLAGAAGGLLPTILLQDGRALAQPRPHTPTTPPTLISYQGYLTDADGQPVEGTADLTFGLYASATGGTFLWSETQNDVLVEDGYFAVLLGNINPLIPADFADATRYLQVTVDTGSGPVVMPRQRLAAAPYAFQATTADQADSAPWAGLTGVPAGFTDGVDNDTTYTAGYGLNLSNTTFQVVTTTIQARVSGSCEVGSTIRAINADGSVDCERPTTFYYPLLRPQTLDLTAVDPGLKGFFGGFSDGRYGYFVPYNNDSWSGKVARVDLQNFTTNGVTILNLADFDADLRGFMSGFTDGRYGYFVPHYNPIYFGKVARVDLQNFSPGGIAVLDLTLVDGDLKGLRGGFTDGHYGYFVPHYNGTSYYGKVARVDLENFSTSGVTILDLTSIDATLTGFAGGFSDGRYGYFVPLSQAPYFGKVVRVDLQNFTGAGVTILDLATVDADLRGFEGGFTDGRYGYFIPFRNPDGFFGKIARVDLLDFTSDRVTILDLTVVDNDLKGFRGGFTDGQYGYFVPSYTGETFTGKVARVDLWNFTYGGVSWIDMAATDPDLAGFVGGFTDGRYGYFVPSDNAVGRHGTVTRIPLFSGAGAP